MATLPLSQLNPGQRAVVDHLETDGDVGLKLVELGFCPGEAIQLIREAPFHGPIEVELMAYRLCIRRSEADKIIVRLDSPLA